MPTNQGRRTVKVARLKPMYPPVSPPAKKANLTEADHKDLHDLKEALKADADNLWVDPKTGNIYRNKKNNNSGVNALLSLNEVQEYVQRCTKSDLSAYYDLEAGVLYEST